MGDEAKVVKIRVTADGTKEASEGLSKVADQLDRQKTAIKAMDDAMAASGYLARLAQYKAEAASLNAVQDENAGTIKKLSAAVEENSKAFGDHSTKLRSQLGAGAGALQQLSGAFSQVVPEVGAFNNVLDVGLRSMGGFLGVLGGGPGIALGGLVAGLGILGSVMSASAKEADALADRTQKNSDAVKNYLANIASLRSQVSGEAAARSGESALQGKLSGGGASSQDYLTEAAAQRQLAAERVSVANLQLAQQVGGEGAVKKLLDEYSVEVKAINKRFDDLRADAVAAAQNEADKAELNKALFEGGTPTEAAPGKPRADDASAFQRRLAANRAAIDAIQKMESDAIDRQHKEEEEARKAAFALEYADKKEQIEKLLNQYRESEFNKSEVLKTNLEQQRSDLETLIGETVTGLHATDAEQALQAEELKRQAMRDTHEEFMALQDEQASLIQQNLAAEKSTRAAVNQSMMALGTTLGQMTAKQLSEAVKGHKIQAAMIVEGIGDAMVAEGVRVMFQGGASMLMGNYAGGAGMLALGAAELAAGLALGAAGSAMQPPAPAGGAASEPSAQPERGSQSSNGASGGHTTIIYVDMPTVVSPSAEDGLRVRMAIDRASLVYGAPV